MTLKELFKSGITFKSAVHLDFAEQGHFFEASHTVENITSNALKLKRFLAKYGKREIISMNGFDDGLTLIVSGNKE